MRIENVTSAQNPKIKALLELQEKSKARKKAGLFVVEGKRELIHCIEAEYEPHTLFVCMEILGEKGLDEILGAIEENFCGSRYPIIEIPQHLYDKVAYRGGTEGVIAEMHCKDLSLDNIKLKEDPLIVVLESVEKPGNLGAILRTCDAAGADALLVCDPLTDLFNPNLIRASLGAAFSVPTVACSREDAISFLQSRGIQILTAQLQDSELYYDIDMKRGTALVMGTESTGLSDVWRKAANAHIRIPMLGMVDSLNVSVSAAVLLYESVRQRNG